MSSAEIERLRRQHETWRDATEATWRAAAFGPGQTILDLGCGPGFTSRDLVDLVGLAGRVIAVDASATATDLVRQSTDGVVRPNLDVITNDALTVDLTGAALDGIFARWLFCYLSNPAEVAERVVRHLRPGGIVAIIDYWNYLAIQTEPRSPLFAEVFAAVHESFRGAGGSLDVGGLVPGFLSAAGLSVTQITPISAVGRPGSPVWTWITDFQSLYLPKLIEGHYLSPETVADYLGWWRVMENTAGAFVFAPPMLSVVATKPHHSVAG